MKFLTLLLVVGLTATGYSYEMMAFNQTDPAHPGKCVTDGLILSPGEEGKHAGQCNRVMCAEGGFVTTHLCIRTFVKPPCEVGDELYPEEPYPKCCEMEIICPEGVDPIKTMTGKLNI